MKKYEVTVRAESGTKTTHRVNAKEIAAAITIARYNYDGEVIKVEEIAK